MKANSPQPQSNPKSSDITDATDDWTASDPVWKLLDEASQPEADAFFARNVVRSARQLEQERPSLAARLGGIFSAPRLVIGAIACAAGLIAWQVIPSVNTQQTSGSTVVNNDSAEQNPDNPAVDESSAVPSLSDLVMTETLSAAAEDPTMFTRDEVVIMLGL